MQLGEWTSDVYTWEWSSGSANNATLCVSLSVSVLPLLLRVVLLRGTPSGGNVSRTSVLEVDTAEVGLDGLSAALQLDLGLEGGGGALEGGGGALAAQIVVQVSENAFISAVNITASPCSAMFGLFNLLRPSRVI